MEDIFERSKLETEHILLYREMLRGNRTVTNPPAFAYATEAYMEEIGRVSRAHGISKILDYGGNDGAQYLNHRFHERAGFPLPYVYDPVFNHFSKMPRKPFEMVMAIDVLEHIPEPVVDTVLGRICFLATHVIFLTIASDPSDTILANGQNAHCTLKPLDWWVERIKAAKQKYGRNMCKVYVDYGYGETKQKVCFF